MTLKNRLTLVGFGIIVFLIITPLLILYARGFKYDFQTHKLLKTGAMVVRTQPNSAAVYLDNQKQKGKTPLDLRFLIPKDYDVKIEKDSYQPWTKRLSVKQQLVTWVNANREFITLFFDQPRLDRDIQAKAIYKSSDGTELVFNKDSGFGLINIDKNSDVNLATIPNFPQKLNFNGQFLWQNAGKTQSLIENLFTNNPTLFAQLLTAQKIQTNGSQTLALMNSNLYSLNNSSLILLDKDVADFTLDGDNGWYIQKSFIKHANLANGAVDIIYQSLPETQNATIIRSDNQSYTILGQTLYVVNDTLEQIYSPVMHASWDKLSQELAFNNNNEVLIYNPASKDSELILRSQTPINNPILNDTTGYLFFQNEGKIKAVELDGRDHRNIYTITDAGIDFVLDQEGKYLYVIYPNEIKEYQIR